MYSSVVQHIVVLKLKKGERYCGKVAWHYSKVNTRGVTLHLRVLGTGKGGLVHYQPPDESITRSDQYWCKRASVGSEFVSISDNITDVTCAHCRRLIKVGIDDESIIESEHSPLHRGVKIFDHNGVEL